MFITLSHIASIFFTHCFNFSLASIFNNMANPRTYVSFILLFTFLLSPHVLTHKLPQVGSDPFDRPQKLFPLTPEPDEDAEYKGYLEFQQTFSSTESSRQESERNHYINDAIDYKPSAMKDIGADPSSNVKDKGETHFLHGNDFEGANPSSKINYQTSYMKDNGEAHYLHRNDFQGATSLPDINYQPLDMKDNEPKNHKDGVTKQHRKMMRPSKIDDLRSFHAFPVQISRATLGGKTTYYDDGVPMGKVVVKTMN